MSEPETQPQAEAVESAESIAQRVEDLPPADAARSLSVLTPDVAAKVFEILDPETAGRALARMDAPTAAVIVGENETTITTTNASMTSRCNPTASGAIGNHGHTIHAIADRPTIATARVMAVTRTIAAKREPSRSTLNVRPAISAISVVAIPVTT